MSAPRRVLVLAALTLAAAQPGLAAPSAPTPAVAPAEAPSPWREDLGDPVLADLLKRADADAPDVRIARARLAHAEADVEAARAPRHLQVEAGAAAAAGGKRTSNYRTGSTPELVATYDLDVFGRLSHTAKAAARERDAARAELAGARLQAGAAVAHGYLALRAAQAAQGVAADRADLAARALTLTQTRAHEGAASADLLAQRRADLAAAQAAQRAADRQVETQGAALAAAVGENKPLSLPPPAPANALAAAPAAVDADAVGLRPDVQAALARLAAADERRAAAVAASRPHFTLTAALGSPDAAIALLLDTRALAWALAGSLTQSVLDGGANRARIHAARAEADEAEAAYRKAVLQGWVEMVSALNTRRTADDALAGAAAAEADARAALARGETRRAQGVADGLDMVALQDQAAKAAADHLAAETAVRAAAVELALARGGA